MFIIDILIYVFLHSSVLHWQRSQKITLEKMTCHQTNGINILFGLWSFTIIGGIRWNVGSDSISYAAIFNHADLDFEENRKYCGNY